MAIKIPRKIGEPKTLVSRHKKSFVTQVFEDMETGVTDSWSIFHGELPGAFILPITLDNQVVAIKQFRFGPWEVIYELPAGGIKTGEEAVEAIGRELLEETGYKADRIISLSENKPILMDPASSDIVLYPFLGLGCIYCRDQELEPGEHVQVEVIGLEKWLEMVFAIEVNSMPSMLTTLLALPHLNCLELGK